MSILRFVYEEICFLTFDQGPDGVHHFCGGHYGESPSDAEIR